MADDQLMEVDMSFENKYPYTDFHELNLDWIISEIKRIAQEWIDYRTTLDSDWEQYKHDLNEEWAEVEQAWTDLHDYVQNYFANLDVQQEINNKLDQMAADGTLDAILLPYFNAYKAEINAIVQTQNEEISGQNGRITTLESRMDAFASLTEGSTTGDAELMDIRVAADGTTYPSAGDAVRAQVININNTISGVADHFSRQILPINGGIFPFHLKSGDVITISTFTGAEFLNVNNGKINMYDHDMTYIDRFNAVSDAGTPGKRIYTWNNTEVFYASYDYPSSTDPESIEVRNMSEADRPLISTIERSIQSNQFDVDENIACIELTELHSGWNPLHSAEYVTSIEVSRDGSSLMIFDLTALSSMCDGLGDAIQNIDNYVDCINRLYHKNVSTVDLSTINWQWVPEWSSWETAALYTDSIDAIMPQTVDVVFQGEISGYKTMSRTDFPTATGNRLCATTSGRLVIYNGSSITPPTGTMYYRLEHPVITPVNMQKIAVMRPVKCTIECTNNTGTQALALFNMLSSGGLQNGPERVTLATYNVGHYDGEGYTHGSDALIMQFRQAISETGADIIAIQEDDEYMDYPTNSKDPMTELIGNYSNKHHFNTSEFINASKYKMYDFDLIEYSQYVGHRYFSAASVNINGRQIRIITVHFEWYDTTMRRQQIAEVIAYANKYKYVIILGDFNPDDYNNGTPTSDPLTGTWDTDNAIFYAAGYKVANAAFLGALTTYLDTSVSPAPPGPPYPCDNIVVSSNIDITRIYTIEKDYMSDHAIFCADVIIN